LWYSDIQFDCQTCKFFPYCNFFVVRLKSSQIGFWRIEAPLHEVYDAVLQSLRWPDWWRGVECVHEREPGEANGIGSVRCYTWKSRIEPLAALEANVSGDLVLQRHKYRRLPRKAGKNDSKQPAGARTATGLWG
jgi:hypothetical protein